MVGLDVGMREREASKMSTNSHTRLSGDFIRYLLLLCHSVMIKAVSDISTKCYSHSQGDSEMHVKEIPSICLLAYYL